MKHRMYLISLYSYYQNLLTDKQKMVFELYFFEDYSLSEISQIHNSSRANIQKIIKTVEDKLISYEALLKINEHYQKNIKILQRAKVDQKIIDKIK